jgi:hypothetical protein
MVRNAARCTIHGLFSAQDARTRLAELHPGKQTQLH